MKTDLFYTRVPKAELTEIVNDLPGPGYIYFRRFIKDRLADLVRCLPAGFGIMYALKANPHPEVLAYLAGQGLGADVASAGELAAALKAGFPAGEIEFTGPAKTRPEIEAALAAGVGSINVESLAELELIAESAGDRPAPVGLRVNPGQGKVRAGLTMAGSSQFGLTMTEATAAAAFIERRPNQVRLTGLHVHTGSQILKSGEIIKNFKNIIRLALELEQAVGRPLGKVNFGGGWGLDYFDHQQPLDLDAVAADLGELFAAGPGAGLAARTRLKIEPGRFLVGESGVYAAEVVYLKEGGEGDDRAKTWALLNGGMNHNYLLAGGMGQVIRRNFQMDLLCPDDRPTDDSPINLAGPLCTPQDVLASDFRPGRRAAVGDKIVFFNCGAYGPTASPINFLGRSAPSEAVID